MVTAILIPALLHGTHNTMGGVNSLAVDILNVLTLMVNVRP